MENISYYLEEMQFLIKPKRENWKTEFESRNLTDWSNVEFFWNIWMENRSRWKVVTKEDDRQEEEKCKWWSVNGRYWSRLGIWVKLEVGDRYVVNGQLFPITSELYWTTCWIINEDRTLRRYVPEVPDLLTIETQNEYHL